MLCSHSYCTAGEGRVKSAESTNTYVLTWRVRARRPHTRATIIFVTSYGIEHGRCSHDVHGLRRGNIERAGTTASIARCTRWNLAVVGHTDVSRQRGRDDNLHVRTACRRSEGREANYSTQTRAVT
jgi:hypothetical protein